MIKILFTLIVVVVASVGVAYAQTTGPTNPSTLSWTAPTLNADGTPLQDLGTYNIRVAGPLPSPFNSCPVFTAAAYGIKKAVTSGTAAPVANSTVTFGSSGNLAMDLGLTAEGQYCAAVTAVDLTQIEGGASNTAPFVRRVAPGAPSGFQVNP